MKWFFACGEYGDNSRSRKGAWIEIALCVAIGAAATVAPVRERGLKFSHIASNIGTGGRSRKGAWIEMLVSLL